MNRSLNPKPVLAQIPRVALEDLPHRISHFVSNAAARAPEAVALVQPGGESWTYARFWQTIRATSGALHRFGVRPGDRVVIVAGVPPGVPGTTNGLRVHKMGSAKRGSGV